MPGLRLAGQALALLVWVTAVRADVLSPAEQKQLIQRIQTLPVRELEAALPAVPMQQWLRQTLGLQPGDDWQLGSCDLKPDYADADGVQMCVEVRSVPDPGGFGLRLHILVGTYGRGVFGTPSVHSQSFMWRWCETDPGSGALRNMRRIGTLSDIPRQVAEMRSQRCAAADQPELTAARYYSSYLSSIKTHPKLRYSFETLLGYLSRLNRVLLRSIGGTSAIERLSDRQLQQVQKLAEGVIVNRDEVLIVTPDSRSFLGLAKKFGVPADVAFFERLDQTYGGTAWPAYTQRVTDVTACTDFASGKLVSLYRAWSTFRAKYPEDYIDEAGERLREIERRVSEDTCACGAREGVEKELKALARAFPKSAIHSRAVKRLVAIEKGRSGLRFNCAPN